MGKAGALLHGEAGRGNEEEQRKSQTQPLNIGVTHGKPQSYLKRSDTILFAGTPMSISAASTLSIIATGPQTM
jgi:hypothetical protein